MLRLEVCSGLSMAPSELERFEGVVTVEVAKFGDNVGAGMHDPKMVGEVTKVEGTARIEKAIETDVG